jgi:hypothetical protein
VRPSSASSAESEGRVGFLKCGNQTRKAMQLQLKPPCGTVVEVFGTEN